jgi:hypothetical protein
VTLNKLASLIAKRESKKVSVSVGNVREILRVLVELDAESVENNYPGSRVGDAVFALMVASDKLQVKRAKSAKRKVGQK